MKKKKLFTVGLCIFIVSVLVVTAAAVVLYKYNDASHSYVRKVVNRINIEVSDTEFTFAKPDSSGMLYCETTVSVEKTEKDFYAMLDSITLSGQDFGYVIYTAGKNNGEAELPENVMIKPCQSDNAAYKWDISFTVPYEEGTSSYEVLLELNYTTGVKPNVTQSYVTNIPITLTVY